MKKYAGRMPIDVVVSTDPEDPWNARSLSATPPSQGAKKRL
jgi:hypothetical protein